MVMLQKGSIIHSNYLFKVFITGSYFVNEICISFTAPV